MRERGGEDEERREKERRCGEKGRSGEVEWRSRRVEEEGKEGVRREDERTVEKRRGGAEG